MFKELNSKIRFASIPLYPKLILYFVLVSIIPIFLIGMISYKISSDVVTDMASDSSKRVIARVAYEVNNIFTEAVNISGVVADDPFIQESLRILFKNNAAKYSIDLDSDARLQFINTYKKEIYGLYVIGENGGQYKSKYCTFKDDYLSNTDWYHKIFSSNTPLWFPPHVGSFAVVTIGDSLISLGLPIIDKATGKKNGIVLTDIQESLIKKNISSRLGKTGYMYILDEQNNVISYPDSIIDYKKLPEINIQNGNFTEIIRDLSESPLVVYKKSPLIIYQELPLTGWKIVGVIPTADLTRSSNIIRIIISIMIIAFCILAFIAALSIAGSIANPLKKLMYLMKEVEKGNLSVNMNVKYNDEIGQLGNSFNVMIEKINDLIKSVYKEQKKLRKAELKALQAQINPHFLYNSLDSIMWLSRKKQNDEVIKMVTALTTLFRIGISRGRDIITIKEEIDHIASYLTIQSIRYKNKFTYDIQVPESLYRYVTLKLILQPIVENAIYHGIKMKREKGCILIKSMETDNSIIFVVEDTGIGMTKEKLEALENTLKNKDGEKIDSYGVKNVDERIKIFFGQDYGLKFRSEYCKGTSVEISIPKKLEVDENDKSSIS